MARQMHCDYISKKGKKETEGREPGRKKETELLMLYGIPLGSRLLFFPFPSKAVLHFDYLVLLKAIQAALFVSIRLGL